MRKQLLRGIPVMIALGIAASFTACTNAGDGESTAEIALNLTSGALNLAVGQKIQLQPAVSTATAGSVYTVEYRSASTQVATVSAGGIVSGVADGTTTLTVVATLISTGASATATVTVVVGKGAVDGGTTTASTTTSTGGSTGGSNVTGISGPWTLFDPASYPPAVAPATCTGCKTYYVDGTSGSDANTGVAATSAFKTIAKTLGLVKAGDTVLIRKGLYREGIDMSNYAGGAAGLPITFGSFGDGEVIVDGSPKVTWTATSSTVSTASVAFTPIAVVVNDVPLKKAGSASAVTSGSGTWFFGSGVLTADLGTTSPNTADVVVPKSSNAQQHVYFYNNDYLTFKGLTIRGSGSNGIWGYGSHITVESCAIKFNGKAAVSFQSTGNIDNKVLTSHIYHNVLLNWPRGANGYASAGGGWPGTLIWWASKNAVARGNVVHMNGGEGILTYGTEAGATTGDTLFEQNMVFDNWSVNMYVDNQVNAVFRNNFIFNHPPDAANYLNGNVALAKFSVCMMLADEYNSSDGTNNHANLSGTQVYNNILAGCRIGIRDYSEGTPTTQYHGLKNTLIANNTIIMPADRTPYTKAGTDVYGLYLQDNGTNNTNSKIQNNIVYGFTGDPLAFSEYGGAIPGVSMNYNDYYSTTGTNVFGYGPSWTSATFATWKSVTGADANSKYADPLLVDATAFRAAGTVPYDYAKANLASGSPARGAGTPQSFTYDFTGAPRSGWNIGAY